MLPGNLAPFPSVPYAGYNRSLNLAFRRVPGLDNVGFGSRRYYAAILQSERLETLTFAVRPNETGSKINQRVQYTQVQGSGTLDLDFGVIADQLPNLADNVDFSDFGLQVIPVLTGIAGAGDVCLDPVEAPIIHTQNGVRYPVSFRGQAGFILPGGYVYGPQDILVPESSRIHVQLPLLGSGTNHAMVQSIAYRVYLGFWMPSQQGDTQLLDQYEAPVTFRTQLYAAGAVTSP